MGKKLSKFRNHSFWKASDSGNRAVGKGISTRSWKASDSGNRAKGKGSTRSQKASDSNLQIDNRTPHKLIVKLSFNNQEKEGSKREKDNNKCREEISQDERFTRSR